MGTFWSDFKKFISKGNVIDLSVGVVIGGAFGKITSSLVADIIMPLVGLAVGGLDVSQWKIVLKEAVLAADGVTVEAAEVAVRYGNFLQMILDFLIIAFSIFCVLRVVMHSRLLRQRLKPMRKQKLLLKRLQRLLLPHRRRSTMSAQKNWLCSARSAIL